ncbi:hypothetical protein FS837_001882 [Tulasnella sp. UAMH 9824]|nr:hypothetical protein FS837_001882 [Tulasnella sp. UAMH 9824]
MQQPRPPPNRPIQFHEYFKTMFNDWLTERQLTLEPPRVGGKEVELHKLFLMVGAFGGYRAVFEKKTWPVVGVKIGLSPLNGLLPYCKSEVAEQLSEIYLKILGDFELHWHNSLRPGDPTSMFPLPPQLQYLHPEIERLATAHLPLQQQLLLQPQHPSGAGLQLSPHGNATASIPNQMVQQTYGVGPAQAATRSQETITRNYPVVTFSPQPDPSGQGETMAVPSSADLPPPLQWLFTNPDILKLGPEEIKRRGVSDEVIQKVMAYRQHLIAKTIQVEKEQDFVLQQRHLQGQQQTWGLGEGLSATGLHSSSLPQPSGPRLPANVHLGPGLNVPPDQLLQAQEKVKAAIALFGKKRDHSSINLPLEQELLLEESIQHVESLLKRVALNLVSFVVLAPNDEHELNRMAQMVVRVYDQVLILRKPSPKKRFILRLGDLNNYRNHFTTFLMHVKDLHDQAMALKNQQNSGARSPVPTRVAQQEPSAPQLQPTTQVSMGPPSAEVPQPPLSKQHPSGAIAQPHLLPQTSVAVPLKPGLPIRSPIRPPVRKPVPPTAVPTVSLPSPAPYTPINQPPTPAPAESRNTQKSPAMGSNRALNKSKPVPKPQIPVKRAPAKPAPKIPHDEVLGTSQLQAERPPSKRECGDGATGPDGSEGPSGLHKRARTDPQDPGSKRNAEIAAVKQSTIEGSLDFLQKTTRRPEEVAATPTTTENGATKRGAAVPPPIESLLQILEQGSLYDLAADPSATIRGLDAAAVPFQDAPAPGVKPEEEDVDDLGGGG